jgi:hypothetical protein
VVGAVWATDVHVPAWACGHAEPDASAVSKNASRHQEKILNVDFSNKALVIQQLERVMRRGIALLLMTTYIYPIYKKYLFGRGIPPPGVFGSAASLKAAGALNL